LQAAAHPFVPQVAGLPARSISSPWSYRRKRAVVPWACYGLQACCRCGRGRLWGERGCVSAWERCSTGRLGTAENSEKSDHTGEQDLAGSEGEPRGTQRSAAQRGGSCRLRIGACMLQVQGCMFPAKEWKRGVYEGTSVHARYIHTAAPGLAKTQKRTREKRMGERARHAATGDARRVSFT